MQRWKLQQYVTSGGRGAIEDWRKKLPPGARADCDTFLKLMVKSKTWEPPDLKLLRGDCHGLAELRWPSGGAQYRILGHRLGENEFLMLIGCTHKQKIYDPPAAFETAKRRFKEISKNEASYSEYRLPFT
jgi:hypothetical protein